MLNFNSSDNSTHYCEFQVQFQRIHKAYKTYLKKKTNPQNQIYTRLLSESSLFVSFCPFHIFFARFLGLWLKTGELPIRESGEWDA